MKAVNSLALATAALALIPGAAVADVHCPAGIRTGAVETGGREFSYVDVSSDDDRSRGAVVTSAPERGWLNDYAVPDPTPAFRWAARGDWRRHRTAEPVGSATIPLS